MPDVSLTSLAHYSRLIAETLHLNPAVDVVALAIPSQPARVFPPVPRHLAGTANATTLTHRVNAPLSRTCSHDRKFRIHLTPQLRDLGQPSQRAAFHGGGLVGSPYTGIAEGEIHFAGGFRLRVREELDFDAGLIASYGYEVYRGDERLYWYDDFPHPNDSALASTFPHHKHAPLTSNTTASRRH